MAAGVLALDDKDGEAIGDELGLVLPPIARVEAWRTPWYR